MNLRLTNDAPGLLYVTQAAPGQYCGLRIRVWGDKGALDWDQETPERLRFVPLGAEERIFVRGHGNGILPAAERPRLIGVEAGGRGLASGAHSASISNGKAGVLHGSLMYLLSDDDGQISPPHSVSAGLDYPGVGPEHSYYRDQGMAEYVAITDDEALAAFEALARSEGIVPALESAHAVAQAMKLAPQLGRDQLLVVNLSGRGDKDVAEVLRLRADGRN